MKISVLQENLAKGLSVVSRAAAGRSTTLPVLANIMLSTDDGRLKLSATNLEIGIACWIGGRIEEPGAITVPARTFADLVNTLPHDRIDMELSVRTQTLQLKCRRSEANIKGIDALEFPLIPGPEGDEQIPVEPDVLGKMIQQVAFAAATDESRLMLTGVLTKFDQDEFSMAAADGFRVSVRKTTLGAPVPNPRQVLIPAKALTELGRIMDGQVDPVEVSFTPSRNQVLFHLTNADLVAQLIDLQFPDYGQIVPKSHNTRAVVDTKDLLKACRAATIFARDAENKINLNITPGEDGAPGRIIIDARSDETGDNVGEVDAKVEGEPVKVALNIGYLTAALGVMGSEQVELTLTTPRSPVGLRPMGDDDFTHVIMPMQIGRG